ETGWVVRGGSAEDTAERVLALLGDAELRRRMGERGREWVEEKWRWDLLAEKLKALL
ncbi:alpha-(1-2)-phosphatidylinositol mannosyltransferase, partial [Streptomyces sp. WAC 05379]